VSPTTAAEAIVTIVRKPRRLVRGSAVGVLSIQAKSLPVTPSARMTALRECDDVSVPGAEATVGSAGVSTAEAA
jgi:hypothetical protein